MQTLDKKVFSIRIITDNVTEPERGKAFATFLPLTVCRHFGGNASNGR